jgi:gamma-glutamyltranspeptidase / glutathione hydrolase
VSLSLISHAIGVLDSVVKALKPRQLPPFFAPPADGPVVQRDPIVVAHHPRLRALGQSILDGGGNAFDAFVAVAAAQNVMAEGASSLAGPLGVLTYVRSSDTVRYLDADFNDPLDPAWKWKSRMPRDGRAVLVPGAPDGLDALATTYGTRPLSDLLAPAIELAADGFPVSRLLATFVKWRAGILKRTEYGRTTFFRPDGKLLQVGDILRQPEVAAFLTSFAREGREYVYAGPWGRRFIDLVQERKGVLSSRDLNHYRSRWEPPWATTYRDHRLYSCSGRCYGGPWAFLALKTLEHRSLAGTPHYSADAALLELLVRIARRVWSEGWLLDPNALEDRRLVRSRLTRAYTDQLWRDVLGETDPDAIAAAAHSYHIIAADRWGNVASGTTTIQSDPWGEGMFVEGIPLSSAGSIPWSTAPGERRLSPFSMHFAFRDKRPRFAVGGISNSVVEASFQLLINLIDYELPVEAAATMPRFGTFPAKRKLDASKNWLDPRVGSAIVKELEGRLKFESKGVVDTGSGGILALAPNGELSGMPVPIPYITEPFGEAG